jgi:hypothetical protein
MGTYQIADGYDNEAGFSNVSPQPAATGLYYPKRVWAADGTPKDKGSPFVIWRFKKEIPEDVYSSLLTQFGLASAISNEVTIRTVNDAARTTWANYNGIIIRPLNPKYERGFYRDIEFMIKMLEST